MIRQFQPGDATACCALIDACLEQDSSYSPSLLRKIRGIENPQSMTEHAKLFYIAVYELENRILGVAGLDLNEIRLLYVSPEYQRRGIGRMLLEHIRSMVPSILFAEVFVYSSEQAAAFYRACGFVDKGPFTFDLGGEALRTVFMVFPIPPS
jgi:N-acetylglutamate synthase-like GNAT family acetyltransferase